MITIDLAHMEQSLLLVERDLESLAPNLDPKQRYKATFICEEMLTNLQRHADFEERKPDVSLSLKHQNEDLELTFKDNSKRFDLLDFPDPDINASLDERETGGLGIFLTKKYAKAFRYSSEEGYNTLKVVL